MASKFISGLWGFTKYLASLFTIGAACSLSSQNIIGPIVLVSMIICGIVTMEIGKK
jgi:hypothetical protein